MNSLDKLLNRLSDIAKEIKFILTGSADRDDDSNDVEHFIELFNKAYPLLAFVDWRFQQEFYANLREFEHRYYIQVGYYSYLKTCISIIDRTIKLLEAQKEFTDLQPTQKYYFKRQKLALLEDLDQVFKNTDESILYYDSYMDHVLVGALEDVEVNEIKLMLNDPSSKFQTWVDALKEEKSRDISYRKIREKKIHDRYCLIDGTELWLIGGSVNRKNMNSIMVTKVLDEAARDKVIKDLNGLWEAAE